MEWGFGYGGSEYHVVSFGLKPLNEAFSPSDLETPEPSIFRSGTVTRDGVQILTPRNFRVCRSKLAVPGHMYPEIKGTWLNLHF